MGLFTMALFLSFFTQAQSTRTLDYKSKVTDQNANFYEIVTQKRAEFAAMDLSIKANNKAMKQFERWAYIWQDKINVDGSFPTASNQLLSKGDYIGKLMETQVESRSPETNPWTQVGPVDRPLANGYVGYPGKGRVNVITEDPSNTDIMYAGSAAGGIWKTINNGALWSPKSDFLAGLGVTDILVDPTNTDIIYMATGDEDGEHVSSIGVFKSADAGETWDPTGLTFSLDQNEYIRDLAFAPGNSAKIFALTNDEIRVSTNSGSSWSLVPVTYPYSPYTEGFQNIVFDPNDATKVVVSDSYGGLYFSTDGGANFALHGTIEGLSSGQQKLKIVSSANDDDYFYGILEDQRSMGSITEEASFRKYRYAYNNTAADLISTTTLTGFNSQGGYNINIAVSPINQLNILVAGVNGFRSTDGGASFTTLMNAYNEPAGVGFYIHADHHHISFVGNTEMVLNGHDGGVHKGPFSATTATPWNDISNTLIITQPYNIAVTQEAGGDNFMMANQDNDGFSKIMQGAGPNKWLSAIAGDGTSAGIDIVNSNIRYLGGTNGQLYRADAGYADGYDQATYILGSNTDAAFVSQMSVHPSNANIIYACHGDIKKSINKGGTGIPADWTALGSGLTATKFIDVTPNGGSIRIYTIGDVGTTVTAKRSDDDGATWTTITPPAGVTLNSFSAVPNSLTVYASASGYSAGNKVYKSVDGGVTWTNISTGLPNIIIKKVVANRTSTDETLYLGTELGPYFRTNIADWLKMGTGLPNVRVDDLEINYTDNILYIGTFGRGMWGISIANTCPGVTKTWDGSWTPAGAPDATDTVIINALYNAATNGNLEACKLTINSGVTVTVPASSYIRVNGDILVEGTLDVAHAGSIVQVENNAVVTNNGNINVQLTTPALNARDFMILGSPMTASTETTFNSAYQVLHHTGANFDPYVGTPAVVGVNFHDQDSNDWSNFSGTLNKSEGYLVRPSYVSGGTYNYTFSQGTLNTGVILNTAYFSVDKEKSPNILSNPYASAIDAALFISSNAMVDEVYFWEHLTTPAVGIPGPLGENFSMEDISTYNGTMGLPASNDPGTSTTPNGIISTGQGFGIKANAGGNITFNNAMRLTSGNTTLRRPVEKDLLWISVREGEYHMGSTTGIGFLESATAGLDQGYDTQKLGTVVSLYSHLLDGSEQLGIQGREAFNSELTIPLGFSTMIEADGGLPYVISVSNLEGSLIEAANVYLVDHLENTITNLSEGTYDFLSEAGTFNNRFTLQFQELVLSNDQSQMEDISVFPNPTQDVINIVSTTTTITKVEIYDVRGRLLFTSDVNSNNVTSVDLSGFDSAIYFARIYSNDNSITKRIAKE
ncbi:T9SS type A sorting domain-containing protein [Ulvibacter antarcticus]|uniref:Putative secreted protein (Por secretion system target) n=1 Tax=Ulvibacter antarcticus TaxID=442714 RepID=A0A3L9YTE6_9FLAO|nr:T9SS type A sorting domain-containing protein [Ulvibacter antarcticus]RMA57762.1 putative secreted protein (Por secretion system target) [Ulvibacter antarcticus]